MIVIAVLWNRPSHKKEKIGDTLTIYMEYPDEYPGYTVLSIKEGMYHPISVKKHEKSGEERIKVVNGDKEIKSIEILLEKDNRIVSRITQQMDEEKYFFELKDYEEGEYNIYLMVEKQDSCVYYVSSGATFLEAVSDEKIKGSTLEMLRDIDVDMENLESITIRNPFQWETKGYRLRTKSDLIFESDEAGKMLIHNNSEGDIDVGQIFCDTPQWDYEITQMFGEFMEEKFCYINAKSVNEKQIDTSLVYIDSQDKLNHIINNGKLNILNDTYKVVFDGNFDIENVYIDRVVELYFCGTVNVSNGIIFSIKSGQENGTIIVNTENNSIPITKKIEFDTPGIDISWVGNDLPEYEYMQQYMNIKSYNTQTMDNNLGGLGTTKLLSGTIYDREDTDKKVDFVTEGNYINIELGYVNALDMSNVNILANMDEEGMASILEKDGEYYCNISDVNGNTRGYKINMQYKEHNLPIVYISTNNGLNITSKDEYVDGQISLNYTQDFAYDNLNAVTMKIRGRGHSSWDLDKKPYKIKFDKKTSLFGLTEAKEWVLIANHVDKSLMRNNLAMSMGSLLNNMVFVPHSYMVDVFINGQYQGVYSISERIEMKQGRIEGEKDSVEVNTDYLLEIGGEGKKTGFGENIFSTTLCNYVEVKTPDEEILSEEQFKYIKDYFQKVDDSVVNLSEYEEYLDIASLIDWFILHEFSYNTDCSFRRSNFLLKKKDGKLYMAAPWDFDYAFGNMSLDSDAYSEWICLGNSKTDAYDEYIKTNWMHYLLKDSRFTKQLKNRWNEVGLSLYNKAMETIDKNEKLIGPSAEENFRLWNCLGVKIQYEKWATATLGTYEEQVQYLRNFISKRYEWMNTTINSFE